MKTFFCKGEHPLRVSQPHRGTHGCGLSAVLNHAARRQPRTHGATARRVSRYPPPMGVGRGHLLESVFIVLCVRYVTHIPDMLHTVYVISAYADIQHLSCGNIR